jgi:hypothetical protein
MGDSSWQNSFDLRLAHLLTGSMHSQMEIDSALRDWTQITLHFRPIANLSLPHPAESRAAVVSGLSPRTSDRLVMEVSLPLPVLPITMLYYIWHPPTIEFSFVLLPFDEWRRETEADWSVLQHSFTSTGKPPLFWRTRYKLIPEF